MLNHWCGIAGFRAGTGNDTRLHVGVAGEPSPRDHTNATDPTSKTSLQTNFIATHDNSPGIGPQSSCAPSGLQTWGRPSNDPALNQITGRDTNPIQ